MKQSHWRIEKPDWDNWAFYPLPAPFIFSIDSGYREYANWGIGCWWLLWGFEWWRHPIPATAN